MTTAIRVPMVEVPADPRRRLGLLEVLGPKGKVALPLAAVAISARVVDRIAEVEVHAVLQRTDTSAAIDLDLGGA